MGIGDELQSRRRGQGGENVSTESAGAAAPAVDASALAAAQEEAIVWQARAAYLQAQAEQAGATISELQARVHTLDAQLRALESYAADLQTRLAQTQAALEAAHSAPASTRAPATPLLYPHVMDVVDRLPRSSDPGNQYPTRHLTQIRHLVIHHTGGEPTVTPQDIAAFHVNDPQHKWPGIGFHFVIAPDGTIYQTNRLETACFHVAHHNLSTVGIAFVGRFDDSAPSEAQVRSGSSLLAWLLQEIHLPLDSIVGHQEFAGQEPDCPGTAWQSGTRWKDTLLERVRQTLNAPRRLLYHYVLLGQTAGAAAEADWHAVTRYIQRFQPAVGFSSDEAQHAENVTIIGDFSGVPPEAEEVLQAAGCRVQRIVGKNAGATKAILDRMARKGQRFLADAPPSSPSLRPLRAKKTSVP